MFLDQAAQQADHLIQRDAHVDQSRFDDLLPAERQELPGQRGRELAGAANLGEIFTNRVVVRQQVEPDLGMAENGRQQIVEIVGDPAGQLPDGLHFLGLRQLFLELDPLGLVAHRDHDSVDGRLVQQTDRHRFDPARTAVGSGNADTRQIGLAGTGQPLGQKAGDLAPARGLDQCGQVLSDQGAGRPSPKRFGRG